jgi:hypothetical protein
LVRSPQHGHSISIIWCSVTSTFTGGISVTCRRSAPACRAPVSQVPHARQAGGSCRIT